MTRLSVNINKIATLRNSRGGDNPNLVQVARDCERFGAEGITVHPRPDERHIRYQDVYDLSAILSTEFNIEGNPKEAKFVELVLANKPHQVTLVPDTLGQLTSDHGWDTVKEQSYLKEMIGKSPILEFEDADKLDQLNSLFGDRWKQPFIDWFWDNFNVPVKTIE